MHDTEFKKIMSDNKGCAMIIAGSQSDNEHVKKIVKSLEEYEIPYLVKICSAHKQPEELMNIIKTYNDIRGSISYITVAGGTDALSGILSFHVLGPVISCPPDTLYSDNKHRNEFNETCLQNPHGSSNAYIAKPENIGKFISQTYAGINPKYRELLSIKNSEKIKSLEEANSRN